MVELTWLLFFAPLAASILIMLFLLNRPQVAGWLATGTMASSFLASLAIFFKFDHGPSSHAIESSIVWIEMAAANIEFGVLLNPLSILMLLVVTGIGSLVFLFSMSYMEQDTGVGRFFSALSLFAFSMLGIVLSNNIIQIFIFWELVGVSSYLLIGFWFEKPAAATAGKKAFMTTRVGDVGMMLGILIMFTALAQLELGSFNFLVLENRMAMIPAGTLTLAGVLIFMGVMGKSAQVPLHVWLPDAMEGPTPVSALIHAATMVAAGVFLLVRMDFLFGASHNAGLVIAWTGGITAFLAGTIAVVQNDIKKVLAYSTLSQLGYMVLAVGLHDPGAGMFHLSTHAFFKAMLFLGSASLIHALHTQDIWEMRGQGLLKKMPITSWTFIIGTLALMGIPPLSGFWSKEAVLHAAQGGPAPLFWISMIVVFLTSFYMGRLCTVVFFNPENKEAHHAEGHHAPHEAGWKITAPLLILAVFSIIAGFFPIKDFITGHGEGHHGESHGALALAIFSLVLAVSGFVLSFFLYRSKTSEKATGFKTVLAKKYYFDEFYDGLIKYVQEVIASLCDFFENFVVVQIGVNGLAKSVRGVGNTLRKLQTGVIQFYALVFTAGLTAIIYFVILKG